MEWIAWEEFETRSGSIRRCSLKVNVLCLFRFAPHWRPAAALHRSTDALPPRCGSTSHRWASALMLLFAGLENFNFEGRGGTKIFNWHHFVSVLAGEAIVHTVLEPSAPTRATSPRPPSSPRWGRCKQHFIPFHVRIGVTELGVTLSKEIQLDIWRSLHVYDSIYFELSTFFGQPDRVRRWG